MPHIRIPRPDIHLIVVGWAGRPAGKLSRPSKRRISCVGNVAGWFLGIRAESRSIASTTKLLVQADAVYQRIATAAVQLWGDDIRLLLLSSQTTRPATRRMPVVDLHERQLPLSACRLLNPRAAR